MSDPPEGKRRRLTMRETPPHDRTPRKPVSLADRCSELNISPPRYANVQNERTEIMKLEEIEESVAIDGFGDDWEDPRKQAVLIFLYGRKFYHDHEREQRQNTIRKFLEEEAIERTLRIAATGGDEAVVSRGGAREENTTAEEEPRTIANAGVGRVIRTNLYATYEEWMAQVEVWGEQDGAMTVLSGRGPHPNPNRPDGQQCLCVKQLVLRRQRSHNCFIHAPAVLQGYLVQRSTNEFRGMIDLSKFVRDFMEDEFISKLVLTDQGGDSEAILQNLTSQSGTCNFSIFNISMRNKAVLESVVDNFRNYGPALVSRCHLDKKFRDYQPEVETGREGDPFAKFDIPYFDEYVEDARSGSHAMVLVGYKDTGDTDTGDGYTFLLQNWWDHMQFCEITSTYLIKSGARITFVMTPQHGFGDGRVTRLKNAEAHFNDRTDGHWEFFDGQLKRSSTCSLDEQPVLE